VLYKELLTFLRKHSTFPAQIPVLSLQEQYGGLDLVDLLFRASALLTDVGTLIRNDELTLDNLEVETVRMQKQLLEMGQQLQTCTAELNQLKVTGACAPCHCP
jgi:hypothetical protein